MFIVYKTVNTINDKFYIGVHDTNKNQGNGFYFGSGKALKAAIKKYGKENFIRYTLFEFETLEEALEKEKNIVTEEFVSQDNTYNLTVGGNIPPNSKNWWTEEHSTLFRNRMIGNTFKLGKKESEETKTKKSESMKKSTTIGRWERSAKHVEQIRKRARQQMLKSNPMSNLESRKRVSLSKIGRKKLKSPNGGFKYIKPEDIENYLELGYYF